MEHLSKIELVGRVGAVRETIVGDKRNVRFSVAVDTVYRGGAGATVQTTWFNCTYWGNCTIEKGQEIHLEGRMVGQTYTNPEGESRQFFEVKVNRIFWCRLWHRICNIKQYGNNR